MFLEIFKRSLLSLKEVTLVSSICDVHFKVFKASGETNKLDRFRKEKKSQQIINCNLNYQLINEQKKEKKQRPFIKKKVIIVV